MRLKKKNFHIDNTANQWGLVNVNGADGQAGGYLHILSCWGDVHNRKDPYHPTNNTDDLIGRAIVCEFYDPKESLATNFPPGFKSAM